MSDIKIVVNCATGAVEEISLTAEEIAEREAQAAQALLDQEAAEAEAAALASAKQAAQDKLKALGLTDLEIAALAGI